MSVYLRLTPALRSVLRVLLDAESGVWGLSVASQVMRPTGTVYPILERLEDAGLVTSRWETPDGHRGPMRRLYELTDSGTAWANEKLGRRLGKDQIHE
jgi:predicted transcriptional regulator